MDGDFNEDLAGAAFQMFGNQKQDDARKQRAELANLERQHLQKLNDELIEAIGRVEIALQGVAPGEKCCPVCGGGAVPNYRKCKRCASDLVWIENIPCEPQDADDLRKRIQQKKEQLARQKKAKQIEEQEAQKKQEEEEEAKRQNELKTWQKNSSFSDAINSKSVMKDGRKYHVFAYEYPKNPSKLAEALTRLTGCHLDTAIRQAEKREKILLPNLNYDVLAWVRTELLKTGISFEIRRIA